MLILFVCFFVCFFFIEWILTNIFPKKKILSDNLYILNIEFLGIDFDFKIYLESLFDNNKTGFLY